MRDGFRGSLSRVVEGGEGSSGSRGWDTKLVMDDGGGLLEGKYVDGDKNTVHTVTFDLHVYTKDST